MRVASEPTETQEARALGRLGRDQALDHRRRR